MLLILSCNENNQDISKVNTVIQESDPSSFFPVTDFLRGQIAEIKKISVEEVMKQTTENAYNLFNLGGKSL